MCRRDLSLINAISIFRPNPTVVSQCEGANAFKRGDGLTFFLSAFFFVIIDIIILLLPGSLIAPVRSLSHPGLSWIKRVRGLVGKSGGHQIWIRGGQSVVISPLSLDAIRKERRRGAGVCEPQRECGDEGRTGKLC